MGKTAKSRARTFVPLEDFLDSAEEFQLGQLPTEQPHPDTRGLAELACADLPRAIEILRDVDRAALEHLAQHVPAMEELAHAISETLADGGRVFLCGCGATGRLALSLETLWRQSTPAADTRDRIVSLMAGGDAALVRSIEGFEDHPEYGARQLSELGFGRRDLLISATEGGETPYVIGATEYAAGLAARAPWFLYCNPDEALMPIERSRRIIQDPAVRTLSTPIGPMALAGSTRMQATTVQMLAIGLPLLVGAGRIADALDQIRAAQANAEFERLVGLVETESAAYHAGDYLFYEADRHAITVLTDSTERAPTFNLVPFENALEDAPQPSLCYLVIPSARNAADAWQRLLARAPRPLEWADLSHLTGQERVLGFDFSPKAETRRKELTGTAEHQRFRIARRGDAIVLELGSARAEFPIPGLSALAEHILLKLMLNIHSTLVMGRLGRYDSNIMTWVRPSNRKLIDRAIRYVDELLRISGGPQLSYEDLAAACFDQMEMLGNDESIVRKTLASIRAAGGNT